MSPRKTKDGGAASGRGAGAASGTGAGAASGTGGDAASGTGAGFTAEERSAMKERAREAKAERRGATKAEGEADVLAKIAEMPDDDRAIAELVHAIVREVAPGLEPRTWYGMPAYALPGKGAKPGPIICFVQPAAKFGARYATLGFNDGAQLDDGAMWPTAFAVTAVTAEMEARIRELVARAAG